MAYDPVFVVPGTKKKRKFHALVYEVNLSVCLALVGDAADPDLLEKEEVQLDVDFIAGHRAVESEEARGRERRGKFLEKGGVKIGPDDFDGLGNGSGNSEAHVFNSEG